MDKVISKTPPPTPKENIVSSVYNKHLSKFQCLINISPNKRPQNPWQTSY